LNSTDENKRKLKLKLLYMHAVGKDNTKETCKIDYK